MSRQFSLIPVDVPPVNTDFRTICTQVPVPESLGLFRRMALSEARATQGQPPIRWHNAHGTIVEDGYGNRFTDLSSGVLFANLGYGNERVLAAIIAQAQTGLVNTYLFANEPRVELTTELVRLAAEFIPDVLAYCVSTGSEAIEAMLKIMRTAVIRRGEPERNILVTYVNGFHGRTMGSQAAGGSPGLKEWLPEELGAYNVQVPFPDGYRGKDISFASFEQSLKAQGIDPARVFGVVVETFQGGTAQLLPRKYATALRRWCNANRAFLGFDEVQAGMYRTGQLFGFQHLGVAPDFFVLGKGVGGGFPLAVVLGPAEHMNNFEPGSLSSTNSGNALVCAAALANVLELQRLDVQANVQRLEPILDHYAGEMKSESNGRIAFVAGVGLVYALQIVEAGTETPDNDLATRIVEYCYQRGVILFAPVGPGGGTIKICPPLIIEEAALREALDVLLEAVQKLCAA